MKGRLQTFRAARSAFLWHPSFVISSLP